MKRLKKKNKSYALHKYSESVEYSILFFSKLQPELLSAQYAFVFSCMLDMSRGNNFCTASSPKELAERTVLGN